MTYLIFPSKAVALELLTEIACSPVVDGQLGAVWVCPVAETLEDGTTIPPISMIEEAAGGRVAIGHPFGELETEWFKIYLDKTGTIISETFPIDWKYPSEKS
jgi:hypothetical protein